MSPRSTQVTDQEATLTVLADFGSPASFLWTVRVRAQTMSWNAWSIAGTMRSRLMLEETAPGRATFLCTGPRPRRRGGDGERTGPTIQTIGRRLRSAFIRGPVSTLLRMRLAYSGWTRLRQRPVWGSGDTLGRQRFAVCKGCPRGEPPSKGWQADAAHAWGCHSRSVRHPHVCGKLP